MLAIKYCNLSCCLRFLLFQDNISDSTLKKLKKYIDNPKFTPENVEKVSKVCYLTEFLWLHVTVCCFTLKCVRVIFVALDEVCK